LDHLLGLVGLGNEGLIALVELLVGVTAGGLRTGDAGITGLGELGERLDPGGDRARLRTVQCLDGSGRGAKIRHHRLDRLTVVAGKQLFEK
jgi:hypothetical protein